MDDVAKWRKRLMRKSPFYLHETEATTHTVYDHRTTPVTYSLVPANIYRVIWNDGPKTKYGSFSDYMSCRYGISTLTVLNGDTIFYLWNGQHIDDAIFQAMLAVRNGTSALPHFDPANLVGVTW